MEEKLGEVMQKNQELMQTNEELKLSLFQTTKKLKTVSNTKQITSKRLHTNSLEKKKDRDNSILKTWQIEWTKGNWFGSGN